MLHNVRQYAIRRDFGKPWNISTVFLVTFNKGLIQADSKLHRILSFISSLASQWLCNQTILAYHECLCDVLYNGPTVHIWPA